MNTPTVSTETAASASGSCFAEARQQFDTLIAWAEGAEDATMSEVESGVEHRGRSVLRAVLQGHLDLRALKEEKQEAVEGDDGERRTQRRLGECRTLGTLVGEVEVTRIRYESRAKVASLCPLDGALNLPSGKYSHQVSKRLALHSMQSSFDTAVEMLEQTSGIAVPKRQAEALVQRAAVDFDAFYAQRPVEQIQRSLTNTSLTVLTTDAKGILVYPQDLRKETRQKLEKEYRDGLFFRKRMAQVGSVYHVTPYHRSAESVVRALIGSSVRMVEPKPTRPKPRDKRVWASIVNGCEDVVEQMFAEALRRDPDKSTTWVAVVDGAKHQLEVLKDKARAYGVRLVIICDIIHTVSYLWDAAKVLEARDIDRRRKWVTMRLRRVLAGDVSQVAAGIRRAKTMRCKHKLTKDQQQTLDGCANYLLNHKHHLRYDTYLAAGYPIASGVIEGTVRHLVNDRMAITGAHWRLQSAEAILRLRALRSSGDFDAYWTFHERCDQQRNHLSRYHNGELPSPNVPDLFAHRQRPQLRLVT